MGDFGSKYSKSRPTKDRGNDTANKNKYNINQYNNAIINHALYEIIPQKINKVNKIAECNLLHNIINPLKRTKILNIRYSPILHGWMNTIKGRGRFKNFLILLESGFSSTIIIRRIV